MAEVQINAELRTEFGKGAARRVRRANRVPGVLYGHGNEPRHISLPGHELMLALKTSNVLLNITIDGADTELALPKDVQRHALKGDVEHVDLILVRRGEKVSVEVPLHVVGNAESGSLVVSELTTLLVLAEATHIPASFDVDVTDRQIGSQVLAKEITLPAGVELAGDPEQMVVNITAAPTAADLEAEAGGELEETGEETMEVAEVAEEATE